MSPGARAPLPDDLPAAAEWYARALGWRIHPLHHPTQGGCSCGRPDCKTIGKHPILKNWQTAASADPAQVRRWWTQYPQANIGLATGSVVVVDLDNKPEADGRDAWHDLNISDDGALQSLTGGGGVHLFWTNPNGAQVGCAVGWRPGIDIRGTGGNLVLPPSVHGSGRLYAWEVQAHPEDRDPAPLPPELLQLLTQPAQHQERGFRLPPQIREGARDDIMFRYAASLRAKGSTEDQILAALRVANAERCIPPLDAATLALKAKSATRYDQGKAEKEQPKTADYITAAEHLGYVFRMNVCNDELEASGVPMSDAMRAKIRGQMRDIGFWRTHVAEDAFVAAGFDNPFHPVRDYLNGLTWDGADHISALAAHMHDKLDVMFVYLPIWLRAAVAKAMTGTQNTMLVLDGPQGIGKSHWARWLCSPLPDLFIEGPIDPQNKDSLILLMTKFIWEVAELGSTTRKADREALKFFLSMRDVTVRKPYGHFDIHKPALASFIGTVNNEAGFLSDPTGSRRFLCTTLVDIDWKYATAIDPNQVWAQARAELQAGQPCCLDRDQARQASRLNERFQIDDPIEDMIRTLYEIDQAHTFVLGVDVEWWISTTSILVELQENGYKGNSRSTAMGIGTAMKKLGVEKRRHHNVMGYCGIRRRAGG